MEKYQTPEVTSFAFNEVITWLQDLAAVNDSELEVESGIFICYEVRNVQVKAKTKR